ncbi:hypothetical protein ONZ45_g10604 [Pleurotus djamor]|nr:hypothetical protein ONZ45_g10604 [Pleurotus djamor]
MENAQIDSRIETESDRSGPRAHLHMERTSATTLPPISVVVNTQSTPFGPPPFCPIHYAPYHSPSPSPNSDPPSYECQCYYPLHPTREYDRSIYPATPPPYSPTPSEPPQHPSAGTEIVIPLTLIISPVSAPGAATPIGIIGTMQTPTVQIPLSLCISVAPAVQRLDTPVIPIQHHPSDCHCDSPGCPYAVDPGAETHSQTQQLDL